MFRSLITLAVLIACSPPSALAEDERTKQPSPVTLSGCVSRGGQGSQLLTLADTASGNRYRLTGRAIRKYAGRRVEIVGGFGGRGLKVTGGLVPSPNVAAQAGALDPARASTAAMANSMNRGGDDQLPEFHVTRVRALDGSCQ